MTRPLARCLTLALAPPIVCSLVEPWRLVVRRYTVRLPGLPAALDGLRVAQMSDLHCSAITPASFIAGAVDLCNRQRPDLVALTGDYVSRRNSYARFTLARLWARPIMDYATAVAAELERLLAPLGIFAVPGNHDHSGQCFDAVDDLLRQAGVVPLVNRSVRIGEGLPVIGVDDLRAGWPRLRTACAGVAEEEPQIILSHNPRMLAGLEQRNCLLLAGHTHGGQVRLPLTSFRRRPRDMGSSVWHQGWYRRGRAQMYVSAGVGSVHFPMRFRCPPEIAVIELRRD